MKLADTLRLWTTAGHDFAEHEELARLKFQTLMTLTASIMVVVGMIGGLRYLQGNLLQAVLDGGFALICVAVLASLKRSRHHYNGMSRMVLVAGAVVVVFGLFNLPEVESRVMWLPMLFIFVFLLRDRREGLYGSLAVLLVILCIELIAHHGPTYGYAWVVTNAHFQTSDFVIILAESLLIVFTMTRYEFIKENNEKNLVELQQQQRFLQALFDASPNISLTTDDQHLVRSINSAGRRFFAVDGLPCLNACMSVINDKIVDQPGFIHRHVDGLDWIAFLCRNRGSYKLMMRGADQNHSFNVEAVAIGEDTHLIVFNDITEIEAARIATDKASRAKSEFLANMSHEIRTPLNGVIGMTELLMRTPLDDKQGDYLHKIDKSSKALLSILNDILDYSKIEAGKLALECVHVNIEEVLLNVSQLFEFSVHQKGLQLRMFVDPQTPNHLLGDPLRITQIFNNLVGNAVKFTDHGEISIGVSARILDDEQVELACEVRDTGIGITAEQQERLFHSFTQADSSMTRRYGGSGLGLVITKQLVEQMNGHISLTSVPGEGSSFKFKLRLQRHANASTFAAKGVVMAHKRVLVVDDSPSELGIIEQILQSWQVDATLCTNASDALGMLREQSFDFLITDWRMPGMDGVELIHALRAEQLDHFPRVIMVTAFDKDALLLEAAQLNIAIDHLVTKPFTSSTLFEALLEPDEHRVDEQASRHYRFNAHILLVEDNEINRDVARDNLEQMGLRVSYAEDGQQAVEMARHQAFDLILMDLQMPVMDGFEATKLIRGFRPDTPIVALSAAVMERDRERTQAAGMNAHLTKPLNINALQAALIRYLPPTAVTQTAAARPTEAAAVDASLVQALEPHIQLRALVASLSQAERAWPMLQRFAREFTPARELLCEAQMGSGELKELVHKLKGVSGNLRMRELHAQAQRWESLQAGTAAADQSLAALLDLRQELDVVLALIQTHVPVPAATPHDAAGTGDHADAAATWDQLREALQRKRPRPCQQLIEQLSTCPLDEASQQCLRAIETAIASYDFKSALALLENHHEH